MPVSFTIAFPWSERCGAAIERSLVLAGRRVHLTDQTSRYATISTTWSGSRATAFAASSSNAFTHGATKTLLQSATGAKVSSTHPTFHK